MFTHEYHFDLPPRCCCTPTPPAEPVEVPKIPEPHVVLRTVKADVHDCPRCGKVHKNLAFKPMHENGEVVDQQDWNAEYFAMCPTTNQPLRVSLEADHFD